MGSPDRTEAAEYYFTYINQVPSGDICDILESQLVEMLPLLTGISEERSLFRYAPEKWSIREALNHVTDTERAFAFRALWFARGFTALFAEHEGSGALVIAKPRIGCRRQLARFRKTGFCKCFGESFLEQRLKCLHRL